MSFDSKGSAAMSSSKDVPSRNRSHRWTFALKIAGSLLVVAPLLTHLGDPVLGDDAVARALPIPGRTPLPAARDRQ